MIVAALCADLTAERSDLLEMLAALSDRDWRRSTPAPGWDVLDQVTHLAWFDENATLAIQDPTTFLTRRDAALEDIDGFVETVRREHRGVAGRRASAWLQGAGLLLTTEAAAADERSRVPWYGPDMSLASLVTSRIMETWAHGQDIADTFSRVRAPSPRLKHIAFLGWRALPNSFLAHGLPVPDAAVRVEVDELSFGPAESDNVVRGSLLDFCLVVTQRRHVADTALVAEGPAATQWLAVAQAFAGPPGRGRSPGQFA